MLNTLVTMHEYFDYGYYEYKYELEQILLPEPVLVEMKDSMTDDDCLDDPIRLDLANYDAIYHHREKCEAVSIDLTDSDVDVVNVDTKSAPSKSSVVCSNVSRNVVLLKECKPLSIKVVDCDKFPWFYKKKLKRSNTEDYIEISDDGEMEDSNKRVKPKIRPVDVSSYYAGRDSTKIKAFSYKPSLNNIVRGSESCQKTDVKDLQKLIAPDVQKNSSSSEQKTSDEVVPNDTKITGNLVCVNVDLKKNTGLVGLRILHFSEDISKKTNDERKKYKEKKKSKKHKEKKHYSSVPVIHIGDNTTKESLKICLDKDYDKRRSPVVEDLFETTNFEDQKPIIIDNCIDSIETLQQDKNICKEQCIDEQSSVNSSDSKKITHEVKKDKINAIASVNKSFKTDAIANINPLNQGKVKQKLKITKKIKEKIFELFKSKPISRDVTNFNTLQTSQNDKREETSHTDKRDVLPSKKKVEGISIPTQKSTTLIFRDNDHKEVFKIKADLKVGPKTDLSVEKSSTPILPIDDSKKDFKSHIDARKNSNTVLAKSLEKDRRITESTVQKYDTPRLCSNKKEDIKTQTNINANNNENSYSKCRLNPNEPIQIARHLMPSQIKRPSKQEDKKQKHTKIIKTNSFKTKKSDQQKIDANILELVQSLGIDITTKSSSVETESVPENKALQSKDPRKTLPDMPGLEKMKESEQNHIVKSDVFTHQNKVVKLSKNINRPEVTPNKTVPDNQLKSNLESKITNLVNTKNKNNLKTVRKQKRNSEALEQSYSNNGRTNIINNSINKEAVVKNDQPVSCLVKGTINVKPDALASVTMTQTDGRNVLRSDGATCHQIVLNKKTNDPPVAMSNVTQIPLYTNYNKSQSANNPAGYENKNPPNMQTATVTHLHNPNMPTAAMNNFQNMQPLDKLFLSVNKLDQPIASQYPNYQMNHIQTVVSNRVDYPRPRYPIENRFNQSTFLPRLPAFTERPRMDFNISYPPTVRCVPVQGNYSPTFAVPQNGAYDNRYNLHQANYGAPQNFVPQQSFCPQQNYMYRPPSAVPLRPMYRQELNTVGTHKLNEGTKVIGENIDGIIRTINLSAPHSGNVMQNRDKANVSSVPLELPVKSKEEMFQELTKEMAKIDDDSVIKMNEVRTGYVQIVSKRPSDHFSMPGPAPKKGKQSVKAKTIYPPVTTYSGNHRLLSPTTSSQSVGYSPPIRPIPTFEMLQVALNYIDHDLGSASEHRNTGNNPQNLVEPQDVVRSPQNINNSKQTEIETPQMKGNSKDSIDAHKKKISIDEYKKRVENPEESNNKIENVKVKTENLEIKSEPLEEKDGSRRQSSDLDLGYDSDTTLRL